MLVLEENFQWQLDAFASELFNSFGFHPAFLCNIPKFTLKNLDVNIDSEDVRKT